LLSKLLDNDLPIPLYLQMLVELKEKKRRRRRREKKRKKLIHNSKLKFGRKG